MNMIKKYWDQYHELIVYFIFGVLTTLVCWVVYALLKLILNVADPVQMQIAVVLRWLAGVIFAYVTNRIYVFHSHNPHVFREFISFAASRALTLLVEMFTMWLLSSKLHINDWIATFIGTFIVMILNYVFSKLFVFAKRNKSVRS